LQAEKKQNDRLLMQHSVDPFGLHNPSNRSADPDIKQWIEDGLKVLYQQHKTNENNDRPNEGGCQK